MYIFTAPVARVKPPRVLPPGTCSNCAGHGYVPGPDGDLAPCCVCEGLGRCLRVVRDDPPPARRGAEPAVCYVACSVDSVIETAEGGQLVAFVEDLCGWELAEGEEVVVWMEEEGRGPRVVAILRADPDGGTGARLSPASLAQRRLSAWRLIGISGVAWWMATGQ